MFQWTMACIILHDILHSLKKTIGLKCLYRMPHNKNHTTAMILAPRNPPPQKKIAGINPRKHLHTITHNGRASEYGMPPNTGCRRGLPSSGSSTTQILVLCFARPCSCFAPQINRTAWLELLYIYEPFPHPYLAEFELSSSRSNLLAPSCFSNG